MLDMNSQTLPSIAMLVLVVGLITLVYGVIALGDQGQILPLAVSGIILSIALGTLTLAIARTEVPEG